MAESPTGYDDQLPWLQPVEDEDEAPRISARKMLTLLTIVLAGAALVAASFFWLGRLDTGAGDAPQLIKAEPGPYKVKPDDPGGLDVAAESETAFQTSAGEDHDAQLDPARIKIAGQPSGAVAAPAQPDTSVAKTSKEPAAATPEPAPTADSGSVIQLGAFKNSTQAERAWAALSARFPELRGVDKMIVPFSGGIRLRAAGGSADEARGACRAVVAGGENCFVVR